ncbi:hypothetical protein BGX26_000334 [Mortierella sp. AD094]|nr:hypothetical protein BGX26_000334 [Mortierella sp. AD094]
MRSEFPDSWYSSDEESDTDSYHGDQPEELHYPSNSGLASYINNSIISVPTSSIQSPHRQSEYYQPVQNTFNLMSNGESSLESGGPSDKPHGAHADPAQSATVCQDWSFHQPQHEEAPARESIEIQAHNYSELDSDPVVYHTIEAQQLSEQITSATMATESQGGTAQIAVVGKELNDDEYSKICNQITDLLRQFTVPNNAPPRFIRIEPKDVNVSIVENSHLCVCTLPRLGALEEDATTLVRISRILPVLVVVISSEDLTEADVLNLHQVMSRRNIPECQQLVSVLLRSCVSIKDLSTVDVQGIMDRGKFVFGASFDGNDLSLTDIFIHKLTKFAVLVFAIAMLLCISTFQNTISQPSHAVLRQIQYHPNGRTSVTHLDLYISNGDPFKSIYQHPIRVRILNEDKSLSFEEVPSDNVPTIADPIVQDLGNGTYMIYTTILRNRNPKSSSGPLANSWLCAEKPRYYLHLWFENGTRVMDTPQELVWPRQTPVQTIDSQSYFGEDQDVFEKYPLLDIELDLKDDEGESLLTAWKERIQFMPAPLAVAVSNIMNPMMSEYWEVVQPVVCGVQVAAHSVVSNALQFVEVALGVISGLVETLLDAFQFVYSVLYPLIQEFRDGLFLNNVPKAFN